MIEKGVFRFGQSESHMIYLYYMEKYLATNLPINEKDLINNLKHSKLRWFYTATGFYDKNKKTCKNLKKTGWVWQDALLNLENDEDTTIFKKYMEVMIDLLKQEHEYVNFILHFKLSNYNIFHNNFFSKTKFNCPNKELIDQYYKTINKKNVLIISSFTELIQNQIENGNFYKIVESLYPNEKDYKINNVQYLKTKYTYFNDGPDNNIFETFDNYIKELENYDNNYKVVLISCGAYGMLFYKYFRERDKIPILMGGLIQPFFGILNNRVKKIEPNTMDDFYNVNELKEYLITEIDEKYKPSYYKELESGCFW